MARLLLRRAAAVDHFAAAQALDIAGVDIYHPSQHLTGREIAFGGAITRSLKPGQNYFVLETQAQGFAQWTPSGPAAPAGL
jgi:beta-galactosidase